jgi:hypothetical protein
MDLGSVPGLVERFNLPFLDSLLPDIFERKQMTACAASGMPPLDKSEPKSTRVRVGLAFKHHNGVVTNGNRRVINNPECFVLYGGHCFLRPACERGGRRAVTLADYLHGLRREAEPAPG